MSPRMIRPFGSTGLPVPILGLGAGPLGDPSLPEAEAARLLHAAVDLGVTLIDAAPSYGMAEERIGRHLGGRRGSVLLSTKCGYGVPGVADWTGRCITEGITLALQRLRTDVIDVMHLHSCPLDVLRRDDILAALDGAKAAGHIRVAAYSGENEALAFAMGCPVFGAVQTSVNVCDQHSLRTHIPNAGGRGVVAKRALANAAYAYNARPDRPDIAVYWDRFQSLRHAIPDGNPAELFVRFAAYARGVHTALVGTARVGHLEELVEHVRRGPLPDDVTKGILAAFKPDWLGLV